MNLMNIHPLLLQRLQVVDWTVTMAGSTTMELVTSPPRSVTRMTQCASLSIMMMDGPSLTVMILIHRVGNSTRQMLALMMPSFVNLPTLTMVRNTSAETLDQKYIGKLNFIYSDGPPHCMENSTVCTCDTSMCNMFNSTSSASPAKSTTTQASTMRCWFGEKHPDTGNETWKVEVCQPNEDHCFQVPINTDIYLV